MSEIVISVRDLSKRYKLYRRPGDRVVEWITGGRAVRHQDFWALEGVSFEMRRGECVGLIGVNGAGKSTLLKILARALYPTRGEFEVKGRLASLLELGTGFHPELTGRQNIFESARLLGFPEGEVRDSLPAILDFAELGDFIDRPVKQYSSGMFVRLAFSLFAHLEPDVYIVDEALAVGDVFFQQKCFERFRQMRERGCTILLVSHDMDAITHLCDRALLLHAGKCASDGDARSVVHDYFALMGQLSKRGQLSDVRAPLPTAAAVGNSEAHGLAAIPQGVRRALAAPPHAARGDKGNRRSEIVGFAVSDPRGELAWTTPSGGTLRFWYLIEAHEPVGDLNVGIHFYDRRGILAFAAGNANRAITLPPLGPGERLVCAVSVTLKLAPGEYTLLPQVGGLTGTVPEVGVLHDRLGSLPPVVVTRARVEGLPPFYGLADLPVEFEWTTDVVGPET